MYRKRSILLVVIIIALTATMITYAEEDNKAFSLESMTQRLISENLTILKMDNNIKLMELRYEKTLEDYEDLQSTIKELKGSLEAETIYKEQALESYRDASDLERPLKKANYEMRNQIYEAKLDAYTNIVKQELSMIKSMEQLKLQIEQGDRQHKAIRLKESYNLQSSYYSLYTIGQEIELLENDIQNLKKHQEIENTKMDLDMSTTENIQSISESVIEMELMLNMLKNQKELVVESIKTKINMPIEEELIIEYEISRSAGGINYSLIQLLNSFKENSLDIEAIEKNVEIQQTILDKSVEAYEDVEGNEIEIATIELANADLDNRITQRDMEMFVKQAYYDFKAKDLDLAVKKITQDVYTDKEKNLHARYAEGVISKIQYDMELQQIERNKLEYDKATIAYLNAKGKLDLIKQGIMQTGGTM